MRELIKELLQGSILLHEVRDFWAEIRIDREIVVRRFRDIWGEDEQHIRDIDESLKYLRPIIDSLQKKWLFEQVANATVKAARNQVDQK